MTANIGTPARSPLASRSGFLSRRRLLASSGAALAATGLPGAGVAPSFVHARQATPMATPSPANAAASLIQFIHFEKTFGAYGTVLDEDLVAQLYGLDVQTYRAIRQQFDDSARQAAEQLLADPAFADRVDQLPFAPGATVVGFGDSITDDLQSWLEILRHLLDLRRPDDQIEVINQGISGDTTTVALPRFIRIIAAQPDWIITMLGTNDAWRYGAEATKTAVSLEETELNLAQLRHLATTESEASWAWITPPPCNEELVAASMAQFGIMTLSNDDLLPIADFLRDQPDPVVDLFARFGQPPAAELMLADGLHPSLLGQQAIARDLVERLTA